MNPDDFKIRNDDKKDKEHLLSDLISNFDKENEEEKFIRSFDSNNSFQEIPEDNLNYDILKSPVFNYNFFSQQESKGKNIIDRIDQDQQMEVDYFNNLVEQVNQ